jgi:hypothetical protein
MTTERSLSRRFLTFSSEVTAFTEFDLYGSGQAECYLSAVVRVVGEEVLTELLDAYDGVAGTAEALAAKIFSDEKLGPIARNIIKLWYAGIWYELPAEWTESFGARENDGTFTASSQSYPDALLWRAIGANPPGARAPGYGAWAYPPVIPPIPGEEPVTVLRDTALMGALLAEVPRPRGPEEQPLGKDNNTKETAR